MGTCNPSGASVGTINDCGATVKNSESDLQAAVAEQGVIGIAINAGGIGFQLLQQLPIEPRRHLCRLRHRQRYSLLDCQEQLGTAWGDNGYILMHRNYNNMCGVAATPAYAIAP